LQNEQINKQNNTLKKLNTQLIENEEALEQSNEAKEQLLSIISHDISSPVRAMYNYEQGVIEKLDAMSAQELKTVINNLHKSTGNIYNLSNNLLDYAFTQQNGFVAEKKPVDLKTLVEEIGMQLQERLHEKQINFENNIPERVKPVSDANLLRIVLRNLVSNAIKFSEKGKTVSVEWEDDRWAFEVKDQGRGMDRETANRILSGQHNHSSLGTAGEKGTGLGMKLVLNCADILQARVSIASEPGKGTCIDFILPVNE
jgi:signal transduction histidine kinase